MERAGMRWHRIRLEADRRRLSMVAQKAWHTRNSYILFFIRGLVDFYFETTRKYVFVMASFWSSTVNYPGLKQSCKVP